METKKQGPGRGPTNLSGLRGASPVLRVRLPDDLKAEVEAKAEKTGERVPDVVRDLLARWVMQQCA